MTDRSHKKPLARNLGEFFGHIWKAIRTEPGKREVVRRTVEEEQRGDVVLRRTTIEEIELRRTTEQSDDPASGGKE
jgi:hypothetical protein